MGNELNILNSEICPITDLPIKTLPGWQNIGLSDSYSISFALIGKNILYVRPHGVGSESEIRDHIEHREKLLKELGLWDKNYIEIRDYADVIGTPTKEARMQFTKLLKQEDRRGNCLGFWGINTSLIIRIFFNVGLALNPTKNAIKVVKDYPAAINEGVRLLKRQELISGEFDLETLTPLETDPQTLTSQSSGYNSSRTYTQAELDGHLDNLVKLIGTINWDQQSTTSELEYLNSPLKPIYEAMIVLKTDIDHMQKEREYLMSQILNSSKISSIRALATGIANEMNNPLTSVSGYAELIKLNINDPKKIETYLNIISRGTERINTMIDNLLQFGRESKTNDWIQVDLNHIIKDAYFGMEKEIKGNNINCDFKLENELPQIWGDSYRLDCVMQNLLKNSMEAFSHITGEHNKIIKIQTVGEGDGIKVIFDDNALGMEENVVRKAFEPFFTTKNAGKSSGLGLSLIREIIADHKGKISLNSQKGKGSTFQLFFPVDRRSKARPE